MANPFLWLLGKLQGMSDEQINDSSDILDFASAEQRGGAPMSQVVEDMAANPATQRTIGRLQKTVGPGTGIDLTDATQDRALGTPLEQTLQNQASTGGGAWEQALRQGTLNAKNSAMALGQSLPGVGYQTALRNIGNAQGAASQRAAGQANILRAEQQQGATGLLGDYLQGQGGQDINQAGAQSDVAYEQRAMDAAQREQAKKNTLGVIGAGGQAVETGAMLLSKGGTVPGEPEVFGDDSRNDTVPAWLSPKEIVLPLHVTQAPDAPERAAAFVRAVKGHAHPSHHFDDGGQVPGAVSVPQDVIHTPLGNFANPFASDIQAPTMQNGALLNTAPYDANRTAVLGNQQRMQAGAEGRGPSVVPQELQNANDAVIAQALQASAGAPASGAAMRSGNVVSGASTAEQQAAGAGAAKAAGEQTAAQQELARSLLAQRAQDLAMAQRKQQAMMRNQQLNMGLDLSQQAMLRGMVGGAAQGFQSFANAAGGHDSNSDAGRGSPSDLSGGHTDTEGFAMGGEVGADEKKRADAFLRALGRAA